AGFPGKDRRRPRHRASAPLGLPCVALRPSALFQQTGVELEVRLPKRRQVVALQRVRSSRQAHLLAQRAVADQLLQTNTSASASSRGTSERSPSSRTLSPSPSCLSSASIIDRSGPSPTNDARNKPRSSR